jgi:hypothetical protein
MKNAFRAFAAFAVALTLVTTACSDSNDTTGPGVQTAAVVNGNHQEATVGSLLPTYLTIQVNDEAGHPLAGAPVTWTVSSGGGTLSQVVSTTDMYGKAIAAWTLGPNVGTQSVTASVAGVSAPVLFTATATSDVAIPN